MNDPREKDRLYLGYEKTLYRITGSEQMDSILDMLSSDTSANNAPAVAVSGSDIMSGVDTSTTVMTTGSIQAGKKTYDNTASGYILGVDPMTGVAKLYIGNTSSYLNWDGTNLTVTGSITLGTSNSIKGGMTDYNTGTGFFLGYSGGAYKLSIGVGGSTSNLLTWDGSTLTVNGYATTNQIFYTYQITSDVLYADDTPVTTTSGTFVKVKEIQCGATMATTTLSIAFDLGATQPNGSVFIVHGQIYKNGVAVGTDNTTTNDYGTLTQSLSFTAGDLIQIYAKAQDPSIPAKIRNFRILGKLIINQYAFTTNL